MKVLVTGGCGYIGSHTIVDLINEGHKVICVDSNIRSHCSIHDDIEKITGVRVKHYTANLEDDSQLKSIFDEHSDIDAICHFAALKAVGESVNKPITYYRNNVIGLLNLLKYMTNYNIHSIVFSSSCTIYGQPDRIPVTEDTPSKPPTSPYGATKQMCEQILHDYIRSSKGTKQACILRYFNPAGAHPSLLMGENISMGIPSLTSALVSAAKEKTPIHIFGSDYPTKDGTCLRDFIHVCDISRAHALALSYLMKHPKISTAIFNLGAGAPRSVLEAVRTFEQVNHVKLDIQMKPRREGDAAAIYADCSRAENELGWKPIIPFEEIFKTAYQYSQR